MSAEPTQKPVCTVVGVGPGNGAAFARRFAAEDYPVALLACSIGITSRLACELPLAAGSCKRRLFPLRRLSAIRPKYEEDIAYDRL